MMRIVSIGLRQIKQEMMNFGAWMWHEHRFMNQTSRENGRPLRLMRSPREWPNHAELARKPLLGDIFAPRSRIRA